MDRPQSIGALWTIMRLPGEKRSHDVEGFGGVTRLHFVGEVTKGFCTGFIFVALPREGRKRRPSGPKEEVLVYVPGAFMVIFASI
mmetsp:Transcript_47089/g.69767  ORF Transcript_47089/g.69767 Transcript_47089/m.69767 type:complete len:85 (-) Transcript_47089:101-355(-)